MGRPLIAIYGPTATGKTAIAAEIAESLNAEIVSADSVAVYRGLDVGSAKPSPEERAKARFHLVDVVEADEPFHVARFRELADQAIHDIRSRGRSVIVCGGTGLYIRALLGRFELAGAPPDPELRAMLRADAEHYGSPALHERLAKLDPAAAARVHPNDRVRIERALEVVLTSGEPISSRQERDQETRSSYDALRIGLSMDREHLYQRISERVDAMLQRGLEAEVRTLMAKGFGPETRSLGSLGYKEMLRAVLGETTVEEAAEEIKRNTRRFAKRQMTWFRAEPGTYWVDVTSLTTKQAASRVQEAILTARSDEAQ